MNPLSFLSIDFLLMILFPIILSSHRVFDCFPLSIFHIFHLFLYSTYVLPHLHRRLSFLPALTRLKTKVSRLSFWNYICSRLKNAYVLFLPASRLSFIKHRSLLWSLSDFSFFTLVLCSLFTYCDYENDFLFSLFFFSFHFS